VVKEVIFHVTAMLEDLPIDVVHIPEKDTDIEAVHDQDPEEAEAIPEAELHQEGIDTKLVIIELNVYINI